MTVTVASEEPSSIKSSRSTLRDCASTLSMNRVITASSLKQAATTQSSLPAHQCPVCMAEP